VKPPTRIEIEEFNGPLESVWGWDIVEYNLIVAKSLYNFTSKEECAANAMSFSKKTVPVIPVYFNQTLLS